MREGKCGCCSKHILVWMCAYAAAIFLPEASSEVDCEYPLDCESAGKQLIFRYDEIDTEE